MKKGIILSFRRGRHTQNTRECIIEVEGFEEKGELIGKKAFWKSPSGKKIKGVISSLHGKKGLLRVRFEKGLPGYAINDEVEIEWGG